MLTSHLRMANCAPLTQIRLLQSDPIPYGKPHPYPTPLIGVGTKEVPLRLGQVLGQTGPAIAVKVVQRRTKGCEPESQTWPPHT